MREAGLGDTVRVHYSILHEDGAEAETSRGGEPVAFTIGEREVIPAIEKSVYGMKPGENKLITLTGETGFGPYSNALKLTLDRALFPGEKPLEVGQMWTVAQEDGRTVTGRITGIGPSEVILDANNRFAGKNLELSLELVEIL